MGKTYDSTVVGAGILGLAVAREMLARRPRARVVVVEQADRVAAHQTSHNSGVIHAGVYYAPGSLKAQLCVDGAARLYDYCDRHGIAVERIGKLIIALDAREAQALDDLELRARANVVPGIRRLRGEEIRDIEPHATGVAALHSPNTGIVDFRAVCERLAEDVQEAGGELRLGWKVDDVQANGRRIRLLTSAGGALEASRAVFCAGLWSDRLAVRAGASSDPRIVPFRGGYLRLRPERRNLVRGLVYPVPDPTLPFLGIHLTRRIDGAVWIGPNAILASAREGYRRTTFVARDVWDALGWPGAPRLFRRYWRVGVAEVYRTLSKRAFIREARRYVPELRASDAIRAPAGVRAQAVDRDGKLVDDFRLGTDGPVLWVRNAPSPAATSSLAIAEELVERAQLSRVAA